MSMLNKKNKNTWYAKKNEKKNQFKIWDKIFKK